MFVTVSHFRSRLIFAGMARSLPLEWSPLYATQGLPEAYSRSTQGLPEAYPSPTLGLPEVYPRPTRGLPEVYPRPTKDLSKANLTGDPCVTLLKGKVLSLAYKYLTKVEVTYRDKQCVSLRYGIIYIRKFL